MHTIFERPGNNGRWYWKTLGGNNEPVATSSESDGYRDPDDRGDDDPGGHI